MVALSTALAGLAVSAREIHVATNGQDTAPGTLEQPLRTIGAAAQRAEPGDVVTVQSGTYREWVKPARGGSSERQRIVYRREFGGWETAAIKFHNSVDTVISNNFIRGVFRQEQGAFGIWMDFGNQGTRISGNVICDTEAEALFLEMDHGPMLIDNNVLLGGGVKANSENMVFAHNLFVDCLYRDQPDTARQSQFFTPHTTHVVGHKPGVPGNSQWYNNLFVGRGLDHVKAAPGYRADIRAEVSVDYPYQIGDVVRYHWKMRLPEDFRADEPRNRWWVMGQ